MANGQIEIYRGDSLEFTITLENLSTTELSGYTALFKVSSGYTQAFLTVTGSTWNNVGNSSGGIDCQTTFTTSYFNYPVNTYLYEVQLIRSGYKQVIMQNDLKINKSIPE